MLGTRKDATNNTMFRYFLVCKGLSNDDVGRARGTVFQEIRPGAGFETCDFVTEKGVGGATVARPHNKQKTRNLQTTRQHPTLEVSTSDVLYTRLPRTTTPNATSKESHAHHRVDTLTLPLLYNARAHFPTTTKRRPIISTMLFFLFCFILRRMGKNKALAHHTSTYFHTRLGFEEAFAFTELLADIGNRGVQPNGSGNRGFHSNGVRSTITVDNDPSDHLKNEELIPRLRKSIKNYKMLNEPKAIMTNGNKNVVATATDVIWGFIIDLVNNALILLASRPRSYLDWAATSSPSMQCNEE